MRQVHVQKSSDESLSAGVLVAQQEHAQCCLCREGMLSSAPMRA